jgi:hypothetical protein
MEADALALLLARIQFAFAISFHFIFPSFSYRPAWRRSRPPILTSAAWRYGVFRVKVGKGVPSMDSPTRPLAQRLGWFVLIWAMSVIALAIIAWLIRMVLL